MGAIAHAADPKKVMNKAVHVTSASTSTAAAPPPDTATLPEGAGPATAAAPQSGYGRYYEGLAKEAGRPLHETADGTRLAVPLPVLEDETTSGQGKRWMAQVAQAAKSTTVTEFLHTNAVNALKPRDNENPGTRKHRVQTIILWACFLIALGIPKEAHWDSDVVAAYAGGFLRTRVSSSPSVKGGCSHRPYRLGHDRSWPLH